MTVHSYDFAIVDVFSDGAFGGNQLAVITDAVGLTTAQMQAIAREFNFAETTFVLPPEQPGHTARLRIFTPQRELPFAGHPTVGSAAVLAAWNPNRAARSSIDVVFGEQIGPVDVSVRRRGSEVHAELSLSGHVASLERSPTSQQIADSLSLSAEAVSSVWCASIGLPFCFAHLTSDEHVDAAEVDKHALVRALGPSGATGLFLFSGDLGEPASLYARMFAPSVGIDEDAATGSASATLAAHLATRTSEGRDEVARPRPVTLLIRQGVHLGRPSLIRATAVPARAEAVRMTVGGTVRLFARGALEIAIDPGRWAREIPA